jgi:hypothetical protein
MSPVHPSPAPTHLGRNLALVLGVTFFAVGVTSALPSYLLGCNSPGFVFCGPINLAGYQLRDGLIIASILLLSLAIGMTVQSDARSAGYRADGTGSNDPRVKTDRTHFYRYHAAIVSVLVAVGVITVLVTVPVPQPFQMHDAAIYDLEPTCGGIDPRWGTEVTFHWSAESSIEFIVLSCGAGSFINQVGTSGGGSFTAAGGLYEFGSACPGSVPCVSANVTGTYVGAILPLE